MKGSILNCIVFCQVSSATLIKTPHSTIQTANQTVEYQCTLNGTQDDVNNSKITWSRPVLGENYNTELPENGDSNAKIAVVKSEMILSCFFMHILIHQACFNILLV
jgi:hypothetical protein